MGSCQQVLRHDEHLRPTAVQKHIATVPDYLIPAGLRATSTVSKRKRRRQQHKQNHARGREARKNREDPLQSFAFTADKLGPATDGKVVKRDPDAPIYALGRSTAGRVKWKMRHGKGQFKNKKKSGGKKRPNRKKARLPGDA